jgi:hypothetical protein
MDTPIQQQSLGELTFFLYQRPLHPELFNIYASRQFFQGDYEVIIWITGGAHVVSAFAQGQCMTELICPPDQLLPKRGLLDQFPFRGERSHQCSWSKGLSYMMNLQVESMSTNLYRSTHNDLLNLAKKRGMFVSFPQWAKSDLVPFSYLDYEARHDELQLHAFHAFPEQHTVLKTQSLFTLAPK